MSKFVKKFACLTLLLVFLVSLIAPTSLVYNEDELTSIEPLNHPFSSTRTHRAGVIIAGQSIRVFDIRVAAGGVVTGRTADVQWHSASTQNAAAGITNIRVTDSYVVDNNSSNPIVRVYATFHSAGTNMNAHWDLRIFDGGVIASEPLTTDWNYIEIEETVSGLVLPGDGGIYYGEVFEADEFFSKASDYDLIFPGIDP